MPGKEAGKAKPLKQKKAQAKDYTDEDKAHLQKKKEEAAALKAARDALLKGKKK